MKNRLCVLAILCLGLWVASCGSAINKNLDDAEFALDKGDYTKAIAAASAAVAEEPGNVKASLLLSAAYSGRGGLDILELLKRLSTAGNSDTAFDVVHDNLVDLLSSTGLADIRLAITTLTGYAGTIASQSDLDQKQYFYQLGFLQFIESTALPTITAQPTASGTITPTDVTDAQRLTTQTDFIDGYANLTNAKTGITSSDELMTTMSKNYCVMKTASVATGTASGISVGVLRDQVLCQLSPTPATAVTTTVANCAVFTTNYTAAVCPGTTAPAL